jgi:hypothetical protein
MNTAWRQHFHLHLKRLGLRLGLVEQKEGWNANTREMALTQAAECRGAATLEPETGHWNRAAQRGRPAISDGEGLFAQP